MAGITPTVAAKGRRVARREPGVSARSVAVTGRQLSTVTTGQLDSLFYFILFSNQRRQTDNNFLVCRVQEYRNKAMNRSKIFIEQEQGAVVRLPEVI
jgi:hypothetical protein